MEQIQIKDNLEIEDLFTQGNDPYSLFEWESIDLSIEYSNFKKAQAEFPKSWSLNARNIVASKYFQPYENSLKQLVNRVVQKISDAGIKNKYFEAHEAIKFENELTFILTNQMASFNSPVWFNLGVPDTPQAASACFINTVDDNLEDIYRLYVKEAMIFKGGGGSGINLSTLRSEGEPLSKGGTSSGPISFMNGMDASAGSIKSGGKNRRAAKMVLLDDYHPDILKFIELKSIEERKAQALIEAGYDGSFEGEAQQSIKYQNANHSVRLSDNFISSVIENKDWQTKTILDNKVANTYKAKDILNEIAINTHLCGDPGIQYTDTINHWHTCKNSGPINASNPCVVGETKVLMADGGWKSIDSILNQESTILTNHEDNGIKPSTISGSFHTGFKPVYRLTTKAGYEILLTGDHKVWTLNRGFIPAKELTENDEIQLLGKVVAEIGQSEDPTFYRMLGAYLGDGNGDQGTGVIYTVGKQNKDMIETFQQFIKDHSHLSQKQSQVPQILTRRETTLVLQIKAKKQVAMFREYLDLKQKSHEKTISDEIFELPLCDQKYVLQGLFTTDGTVANYGDKSQYVALDSSSHQLLKDVQILLLGFGIKSKLYTNRRNGKSKALLPDGKGGVKEYDVKPMFSLRISRSGRKTFESLIGFYPKSPKQEKLEEMNIKFSSYQDNPKDKVKSLEFIGEREVFDLTEPLTNTFVANGITVHNCSEYLFLDNSSCNLSSINLLKFDLDTGFDVESFIHVIKILIIAQDIIVGLADYPDELIKTNSIKFRPLGLGFTNLGALLMSNGLPYDSEDGRMLASKITCLMTAIAYHTSTLLAKKLDPFDEYENNSIPMKGVMAMHSMSAESMELFNFEGLNLTQIWNKTLVNGIEYGYRNAQTTVLAPTGTISFMMEAETTGIEPAISLSSTKLLVGGGRITTTIKSVETGLDRLGYSSNKIRNIMDYIATTKTIIGAPDLEESDLPVFNCALGTDLQNIISPTGHIDMMAEIQPFLSGGISKTVNLPHDTLPEEISFLIIYAWKKQLKSVAFYRDNSKVAQPYVTKKKDQSIIRTEIPIRRKLPDTRDSRTHKFEIDGHKGYVIVGEYENGLPGEVFIKMSKQGSTLGGVMDAVAVLTSICLQYNVPLKDLVKKFSYTKFEPSGMTKNPKIPMASSILDYIFKYLGQGYLSGDDLDLVPEYNSTMDNLLSFKGNNAKQVNPFPDQGVCSHCGGMLYRTGTCLTCMNCTNSDQGCS